MPYGEHKNSDWSAQVAVTELRQRVQEDQKVTGFPGISLFPGCPYRYLDLALCPQPLLLSPMFACDHVSLALCLSPLSVYQVFMLIRGGSGSAYLATPKAVQCPPGFLRSFLCGLSFSIVERSLYGLDAKLSSWTHVLHKYIITYIQYIRNFVIVVSILCDFVGHILQMKTLKL